MKFINKAVYLENEKILIIADLHIGYDGSWNTAIPRHQYKTTLEELEEIFKQVETRQVIILGDFKHYFGENKEQEWREVRGIIEFLEKKGKVIIIRGNHDNYLANIASKYGIEVKDYYIEGEFGFIHGHRKIEEVENCKTIFLGHLHPAVSIREGVKTERYKCFLVGRDGGREIVILPSFFPLVEGMDVSMDDTHLAYRFNLKEFNVFVVGDRVYEFGKLKKIGKLV